MILFNNTLLLVCAIYAALIHCYISQGEYDALLECANFASISYCLKYDLSVGKISNSCGMKKCQTEQFKDVEIVETFNFNKWGGAGSGYLAIDHKLSKIILTFRGTASRRDWIGNFEFFHIPYKSFAANKTYMGCERCFVHKGFFQFLELKCKGIIYSVKWLMELNPGYKLIITGHSLGGALALLSGIEFKLMGYEPLVVTFASPRVGDSKFARWVDETVFKTNQVEENILNSNKIKNGYIRVYHYGDLIPKLPPYPAFEHAGLLYEIPKRELPHHKEDINRKGKISDEAEAPMDVKSEGTEESMENEIEKSQNSLDTLLEGMSSIPMPAFMGKVEHKQYLIQVTGCDDSLVM